VDQEAYSATGLVEKIDRCNDARHDASMKLRSSIVSALIATSVFVPSVCSLTMTARAATMDAIVVTPVEMTLTHVMSPSLSCCLRASMHDEVRAVESNIQTNDFQPHTSCVAHNQLNVDRVTFFASRQYEPPIIDDQKFATRSNVKRE
jgi:hypothetical protein